MTQNEEPRTLDDGNGTPFPDAHDAQWNRDARGFGDDESERRLSRARRAERLERDHRPVRSRPRRARAQP